MEYSIALIRLCRRDIPGKHIPVYVVYADVMRPVQAGWVYKFYCGTVKHEILDRLQKYHTTFHAFIIPVE